ncbi:hypothetical protein BDV39DRAFT_200619 [Aspergillus sergii]|uniref:Uncharacterized protein n=1 Tax=Aspergillus sergii TaxID=1034303 RepID=A0A5N6XFD3_9EURO|nr:hypothetical protein BDV39DRAFT_200619 [Aspergillus sergii]
MASSKPLHAYNLRGEQPKRLQDFASDLEKALNAVTPTTQAYYRDALRAVFCVEIADNMTKVYVEKFTIWIRSLSANVTIALLGTSRRSQCALLCRLLILRTRYTEMEGYALITEATGEDLGPAAWHKRGGRIYKPQPVDQ